MTTTPKSKIYTKTGDKGVTSLVDGSSVNKSHIRVEAYGTLDELNSMVGLVLALLQSPEASEASKAFPENFKKTFSDDLLKIQIELFNAGSLLATADEKVRSLLPPMTSTLVQDLENRIDEWTSQLPELKNFILPGGSVIAGHLHLARTICRRSERVIANVEISAHSNILIFINRLSDYFFVAARFCNYLLKQEELLWRDLRKKP